MLHGSKEGRERKGEVENGTGRGLHPAEASN